MKYRVQWDFESASHGPWKAGDEIELAIEQAEHANRESPGVLVPVSSESLRQVEQPPQDRMVRKYKTRSKKNE